MRCVAKESSKRTGNERTYIDTHLQSHGPRVKENSWEYAFKTEASADTFRLQVLYCLVTLQTAKKWKNTQQRAANWTV
jgi:hypothetical protein